MYFFKETGTSFEILLQKNLSEQEAVFLKNICRQTLLEDRKKFDEQEWILEKVTEP